jgi:hypothetical protein
MTMHETILHTDLKLDECKTRLAAATSPWPGYWTVAGRSMVSIGRQDRVIARYGDKYIVLAIERYKASFPFYRGIGFRLACNLSEEIGCSGTRIVCRLNNYLLWRVLAISVFILLMAFNSLRGTGRFPLGFWLGSIAVVFIGLLMPSFLDLDDRADMVSFLIKTLNASEVKPE